MLARQSESQLKLFSLTSPSGMKMNFIPYGGKVISLWVPDRQGKLDDVMLGYDHPEDYLTGNPFFGAIIGRYANRIREGRLTINGKHYQLPVNNGKNTLHGGPQGFHQAMWHVQQVNEHTAELFLEQPHLTDHFPGTLKVKVTYSLTAANEWKVNYEASTDQPSVLNLTHHAFFNLKGEGQGDILSHRILIQAERYCTVDDQLIPTGELPTVKGTPLDFTVGKEIGKDIDHQSLQSSRGFDHNWVLRKDSNELSLAARVMEDTSGRMMEVYTTEPGLQFCSGNFLDGSDIGKGGKRYGFRSAFCLEAQHFPDSPHHSHFPSTVLLPHETYRQETVYRFNTF